MRLCVLLGLILSACAAPGAQTRTEAAPAAPGAAPAPAPAAEAKPKVLYERLGGQPAIEAVVDRLLKRALTDERINYTWAGTPLPRVRQRLVELVCAGTGGGCKYTGRDMAAVHRGMGITGAQFGILVEHLLAAMDELKVPAAEKGEVLAILGPMKGAIVEDR